MERAEKRNKKGTKSIRAQTPFFLFITGLLSRLSFIFISIRMVFFSNWQYIALATLVSSIFWIIFSVFDQLLFFSPVFVFYLPDDAVTGFILSNITAVLMGVVVSMNVYVFRHSKGLKINAALFFSGSTLSVLSSTCVSCYFIRLSSRFHIRRTRSNRINISFELSDTFTYYFWLSLLIWALYSISKKLTTSCRMNSNV